MSIAESAATIDRRQAEAALRDSEERFRDFAETAADWFWETGPDLRFTYVAGQYKTALGLSYDEIIGNTPRDLFAKGKRSGTEWERHFPIRGKGRPSDKVRITAWFETKWTRADGVTLTLRVSGRSFNEPAGAFRGYRGTVRDVTDRVASMEALRKLSRAVEQSPNLILITDPGATIEYVNPTFCRVSGYEPEEVVGEQASILSSGETPPALYKDLWRTIKAGKTWQGELCNRKRDGSLFWNAVAISPITDDEGRLAHFLGIQTDVTEQKLAEEQVRVHREELTRVTRILSMGETATTLAHELNQPLSAIVSYAEGAVRRLRDAPRGSADVVEALEETVALAKHASEIVQNIRSFLYPRDDESEPLDINAVVQEAALLIRNKLERRRTRVNLKLARNLGPVDGNSVQLEQVLVNLMMNGVEAMKGVDVADRELFVSTLVNQAREIEVTVMDRGAGIPAESEGRIFDTFFTTKRDGLGMGLAICRTITEGHGGRLWMTRNAARGVTFHIALPASGNENGLPDSGLRLCRG